MKVPSKKTMVVVTAVGAVAVARVGLPVLLTWLANLAVRKIPGIRGKVRRVQFDFMAPGLTAKDISVVTLNGGAPGHRIEVGAIAVNSQWKALLTGALVASLRVDAPRLWFNADGIHGAREGNEKREAQHVKSGPPWQEKLTQLPRFKVASAILTDGEVRVLGVPGDRDAEISLDRLNLRAENITNSTELAPTLMARLSADARLLSSGTFKLQAQGYPLAKLPTFNADSSSTDIDLTVLQEIIRKAVDIDVRHGIAGLYVEAAAADGYIRGYAKPVFDHLELDRAMHSGFFSRLKAWAAKAIAWLITNKHKDRIATRLDFEGAVDDPDLDITDAVLRFIRNAFSTAERASLEHRIRFLRAAKTPDEVIIRDQGEPRGRISAFFTLAKETYSRWSGDSAPRMAADPSLAVTDVGRAVQETGVDLVEAEVAGLVIVTQSCDIVRSCTERRAVATAAF
jgi:hypothetical protein